jgi:hypothetical protein
MVTPLQCRQYPFLINGFQHRNDHFKSLWSLLRPIFPTLTLSLKFAARFESPGPNSQLRCSAEYLQDNSSARTMHVIATLCCVTSPRMRKLRGHKESTATLLLCDVIKYAQAARTQRKHYCSIVVCVVGVVYQWIYTSQFGSTFGATCHTP